MTRILAIKTVLMMSLASIVMTLTIAVTAALAVGASATTGGVFDRLAEFVLEDGFAVLFGFGADVGVVEGGFVALLDGRGG